MATRLHGVLVDGLNKPLINTTVTLLARQNTLTILNGSEAVFRTDSYGAYNITVQAGHYNVIVGPQGIEPYKAGEIALYADSPEGSLNGYLVNWVPEELTPDVIKQVQELVANSEAYALQAGRSAAAANADATDARTSKAAAQTAASEALTYKNDAKGSADEAKLAQQGASGSANTATQAVTTINGLKADVEQLKTDTQGIKDSAVRDVTALKEAAETAAGNAATSETNAGQYAQTATEQAGISTSAATRSENAAQQAETVLGESLKKDQNLADVPDKAKARESLKVERLDQSLTDSTILTSGNKNVRLILRDDGTWGYFNVTENAWKPLAIAQGGHGGILASGGTQTILLSPNKDKYLFVNDSGAWGCYSNTAGTGAIALPISSGGTGATNAGHARTNIGVGATDSPTFAGVTLGSGYSFTQKGGERNDLQLHASPLPPLDDWVNFTRYNWYNDMSLSGAVRAASDKIRCHRLRVSSPGVDSQDFDFYPQGYIKSRSYNGVGVNGYWGIESVSGNLTPFWAATQTMDGGWCTIASGGVIASQGYQTRTTLGTISNGVSGWGRSVIKILGDTTYHRAFEFNGDGNLTSWAQSPGDQWGGGFTFTKSPTSDRDLKTDIVYTDGKEAYNRVMQWLPTLFKYKWSDIQRYGFIGQDLMKVDPQYVKLVPGAPIFEDVIGVNEAGEEYVDRPIETGVTDDTLALDSNVMLVDLGATVVYMGGQMEQQRKEIDELKAIVAKLTGAEPPTKNIP